MAKTQRETLAQARAQVLAMFQKGIDEAMGEQIDDASFDIPTDVDGKEIWVNLTFKAHTPKTRDGGEYDPFAKQEEWKRDKEIKAREAETKRKAHEEKVRLAEQKRKAKKGE